jgi:two-component system, OmpR family, response regulator
MAGEKILVVDDEPNIRDVLATVLEFHGFEVIGAATGGDAVQRAEQDRPDLIVLDVALPDLDGLTVCRNLRARGHNDYVTKPFTLDELLARVRAVLRRVGPGAEGRTSVLSVGNVELDEGACQVRRGGTPVRLSPTEFNLLRYLMENPGRVLSRSQILDAVWDHDYDGMSNVVDTYIGYLRRKLDPLGPPLIHTQREFGYVMRDDGPAER